MAIPGRNGTGLHQVCRRRAGSTSEIIGTSSRGISHANWLMKKISNPDVNRSKLSFMNAFTGFTHRLHENSSADLIFYNSNDTFRFSNRFDYHWPARIRGNFLNMNDEREEVYGYFQAVNQNLAASTLFRRTCHTACLPIANMA
jgi:hypothetical protein